MSRKSSRLVNIILSLKSTDTRNRCRIFCLGQGWDVVDYNSVFHHINIIPPI